MIVQRLDKCYEVVRKLGSTSRMAEFLCQEQQLQEAYLLVRIKEPTLAKRFTLFLEEKIKGREFLDYKECFQSDGAFYAVFTYSQDRTLADKLGMDICTTQERAEIVRRLLEQMLLRSPHPYFMRNSLRPDMITVADSLDVDWNYHLDEVRTFDYCTMETVCQRLSEVIELMFEEELSGKRYPLLEDYLLALAEGKISTYLELYQEFQPVYKALCKEEQGPQPQTRLQRLWEGCRKLGDKPDSLKGYLRLGKRYVAKKLAFVLALFFTLLCVGGVVIVYPWVEARFLTKTMVIHSQEMEGYTGKVRLVEDLEADNVIFEGRLVEGKFNGHGTLYDLEGNLRYRGEFLADQYAGMGESYYQNGNVEYTGEFEAGQYGGTGKLYNEVGALIYEGGFSQGLYEGSGLLYYSSGSLTYEGDFSQGMYEGSGTLYYPDGQVRYRGGFSQGLYEGMGVLFYGNGAASYEGEFLQGKKSGSGKEYDESGNLLYDGAFAQDQYEGEGTLYQNGEVLRQGSFHLGELTSGVAVYYDRQGNLLYQGGISNGLYDGQGKLFSEGTLIYEGGFAEGNYHGRGREYQAQTGELIYDGMFEQEKYSGKGRLYDVESGGLLYEGSFYQGLYDGEGKLYDPVCNYLIYEGEFREDKFDGKGAYYIEGILDYEGEFLMGVRNGRGTLYDRTTGEVVFKGIFYNDKPMKSADPEQAE